MSDLTRFRDHARKMAVPAPGHTADCALWAQLADEVDAYLEAKAVPVEDLFGEATVEPAVEPVDERRPVQAGDVVHTAELTDGTFACVTHPPGVTCSVCLVPGSVSLPEVPC